MKTLKYSISIICSLLIILIIAPSVYAVPEEDYSEQSVQFSTVIINSNDAISLKSIPNITYKVRNDDSGELLSFSVNGTTYNYNTNGTISAISSDSAIYLTLPIGDYSIIPESYDGYITDTQFQNLIIDTANNVYTLDFNYKPDTSNFTVNILTNSGAVAAGYSIQMTNTNGESIKFVQIGEGFSYVNNDAGNSRLYVNEIGKINISNLPSGRYNVFLINLNDEIIEELSQVIDVPTQESIEIRIPEKDGNINLSVVNKELTFLKGTTYNLFDSNGNVINFTKDSDILYTVSSTGNVNTISFVSAEPILIQNLPAGDYTIKEVNSLIGYLPVEPQIIKVESDKTTDYQINQVLASGTLIITVTEEKTDDTIEGFVYSVSDEFGKTFNFTQTPIGTYVYDENGPLNSVTTNASGMITIEGLPLSDIIIRGKETPPGFILDTTGVQKTISVNNTTLCDFVANRSNIAITIYDENETGIVGVDVQILDSNNRNSVLKGTTNANGKILLSTINPGDYTYIITSVPEYYFYDETEYSFSIDTNGTATNLSTIILKKIKIQAQIGPANESNSSLENARFGLYSENGTEIETAFTNSEGIATFTGGQTGIGYGNYTIKQLSAPVGYSVSDKVESIEITENYKDRNILNFSSEASLETTSPSNDKDDNTPRHDTSDKSKVEVGDIIVCVLISLVFLVFIILAVIIRNILKSKQANEADDDEDEEDYEDEDEDDEDEYVPPVTSKPKKNPNNSSKPKPSNSKPKKVDSEDNKSSNNKLVINLDTLSDESRKEIERLLSQNQNPTE